MKSKKKTFSAFPERLKDLKMQEMIRKRADWSLAILGKAFVRHGSGRFLNIRSSKCFGVLNVFHRYVMKSKKIYLVTALCFGYKYGSKRRSKDGIYRSYLKRTSPSQREYFTIINKRTFYWFSTLVDAQKCIKRNYCDMCEAVSFPEAVIEEVFEGGGVYDVPRKEWWYKWKGSYKKGGYKPWKKPKEYHGVVGFGIG